MNENNIEQLRHLLSRSFITTPPPQVQRRIQSVSLGGHEVIFVTIYQEPPTLRRAC